MRYGSLVASAAVLLGVAACKGKDAGMSDDLAKDLATAKTSDALALAPHAGVQTVVSTEELSPQGRARLASSSRATRLVAHHTLHRDRIPVASAASTTPAPVKGADAAAVTMTPVDPATTTAASSPRPVPVDVSYPSSDPGATRGDGNGSGSGGIGGIGGIIGAIGGAVLRGGVVDGDHCDERGHRGGGILINRRGPILRGTF
ncbi:MAG: hypothetical protein ABI229_12725 [Gemmatimonadaceae bacterium]